VTLSTTVGGLARVEWTDGSHGVISGMIDFICFTTPMCVTKLVENKGCLFVVIEHKEHASTRCVAFEVGVTTIVQFTAGSTDGNAETQIFE